MLLPLLVTALLQVTPGDTLFVNVSSLNLRAKPKATARIRVQVPIGSACSVVSEAKDGWAELECPRGKGFGKLDLLGPTPPDHSQLLAQGLEPSRPLPEAMNLLQRALALKPSDEPTQKAFRELFWKAEFDRLVRARAAKDILKTPQEASFPEECGDASECVKATLKPEVGAAWEEVRVTGKDVVLAQLFADGLFHLRSGAVDAEKRIVTVQLESLLVPSTAVLEALGARNVQDACQPVDEFSGLVCGYEYSQNCGPDDCWNPKESCMEDAAKRCGECKSECGSTCGDCRMKCGTHDRKGCVESCIAATRACEEKCQAPIEAENAACEAQYAACSAAEEREWNRTCKAPCERVYACVERCQKNNPGTGIWACVDRCDDRLPSGCGGRCLFRYQ